MLASPGRCRADDPRAGGLRHLHRVVPDRRPPPVTSSVLPAMSPWSFTAWSAVRPGMPMQAPASKSMPSGRRTACAAGRAMNSAAVPKGRFHWPFQVQTRSPTRLASTPSPTASMMPAPSECGMMRGADQRPAAPALHIGWIDARSHQLDEDFARGGLRRFHFPDGEHLPRVAVRLVPGSFHRPVLPFESLRRNLVASRANCKSPSGANQISASVQSRVSSSQCASVRRAAG